MVDDWRWEDGVRRGEGEGRGKEGWDRSLNLQLHFYFMR